MFLRDRVSFLEDEIRQLNRAIGDINNSLEKRLKRLECSHPVERQTVGFHHQYYIECTNCGKILDRFDTKEDLLFYQLRQLKNEIANLPNGEEEDE